MRTLIVRMLYKAIMFAVPFVLGTLSLTISKSAFAQSYSCDAQLTPIEQSICDNPTLSELDVQLSRLYKSARQVSDKDVVAMVKSEQRDWVKKRNRLCGTEGSSAQEMSECIELLYLGRISQLEQHVTNTADKNDAEKLEEPQTIPKPVEPSTNTKTLKHPVASSKELDDASKAANEAILRQIMREGYIVTEAGIGNHERDAEERSHGALETALACAKRLNSGANTKRKTCYNYDQEISPVGMEFSSGRTLCSSVLVLGAGSVKTLIITDSVHEGVTFEDDTVSIKYGDREFFYNFKRDKGYSILGGVMRDDFSQCGDTE